MEMHGQVFDDPHLAEVLGTTVGDDKDTGIRSGSR
jgi:hypothetical protein